MDFSFMAQVNGKPMWDMITALFGGAAIFLQSALSLEISTWMQILGGLGLFLFCLIRSYYWIKHDGFKDAKRN